VEFCLCCTTEQLHVHPWSHSQQSGAPSTFSLTPVPYAHCVFQYLTMLVTGFSLVPHSCSTSAAAVATAAAVAGSVPPS